ncbi:meiotic recombination protein REC114 isoform X1 [Macaca thibetana thibetana]|uniref:REC114 meiotic recombination protein n=1 Tax=Macaca mulatta TaxID=9544 RepID=F6YT65_MACMU|nr:meiotic recombination protein REC114 isoform X1 [Macaca mulatta]XP_050653714.1 meiotic recombination protein REC114 isoform X1 [Macaca thibetana thibetana]
MAEAGKVPLSLGLTGGEATEWPLQRYARCIPSNTRDPPGPSQEAGTAPCPTWKVFDSNEESGYLVLTIVISGHFFIFQGQTLLGGPRMKVERNSCMEMKGRRKPKEGFSLVGSKDWLKIVRRMDCLLFGTTIKDKSRLFRVQFSGESKEQALEHCCSCVQKLAQYITVQVPDGNIQELQLIPGPPRASGSQGKDSAKSVPWQAGSHQHSEQQVRVTAGTGAPDGRTSLTQLAQTLLASEELPRVYEQSAWGAEELGPFLRLCLMDQNFPAFVEEVEKELKKLAGLRN